MEITLEVHFELEITLEVHFELEIILEVHFELEIMLDVHKLEIMLDIFYSRLTVQQT